MQASNSGHIHEDLYIFKLYFTLEVLIEKGSAAVSYELRIGQRQFVEQLNI